jgi:hypothetical protein
VSWAPSSDVQVQYTGSASDGEVNALTQNWQETILAPDGTACGSDTRQPTHAGITVTTGPRNCIAQQGDQTGWQVRISYDDTGTARTHTVTENLTGTPPSYVACRVDPTVFAAAWAGTAFTPAVQLTFSGQSADLAGCSGWTYQVVTPTPTPCSNQIDDVPPQLLVTPIGLTCTDPPTETGWTVHITFVRPNGKPGPPLDVDVVGPVPA